MAHLSGLYLILLTEGYLTIRRGIRHCLPDPYQTVPDIARGLLYQRLLALRLIDQKCEPRPLLKAMVRYGTLGPSALQVLFRRFDQHIVLPGIVPLMAEAGDDITDILTGLRKVASKAMPLSMKQEIRAGRLDEETLDEAITTAVNESLFTKLKGLDPLTAAAQALDGAFDIVPRAIGNQLRKRWQRDREVQDVLRRGSTGMLEISFRDSSVKNDGSEETDEATEGSMDDLPATAHSDSDELVKTFLARHPKHEQGVLTALSNESLRTLARRRRVSVSSLKREQYAAKQALKQYLGLPDEKK